jgi:hypothetical protein
MYKGIFLDRYDIPYALINISSIDVNALQLTRMHTSWFVLPSEIINNRHILNIGIDEQMLELFLNAPHLGLLTNAETNDAFILPDVAYTCDEFKQCQFHSIFGVSRRKVYKNCRQHYFFNNSLESSVIQQHSTSPLVDKNIGITRYAVFVEGKMYIESEAEFSLSDNTINRLYSDPCIVICYSKYTTKPDLLVKDYSSFFPLSCHALDKVQINKLENASNQNMQLWIK